MTGILAIWNDCAPEGEADYERWYQREHLIERVAVPGFRSGRRYEAFSGDRRFFTFYEVDHPDVLTSPAYLERLDSPTPWTRDVMPFFRGTIRTVCEVAASAGEMIGGVAVTLRTETPVIVTAAARTLVEDLARRDGVARAQLWTAAGRQTRTDTREARSRGGPDGLIGGALVVECVRRSDAERIAGEIGSAQTRAALGLTGADALGIYGLLCIHARGLR